NHSAVSRRLPQIRPSGVWFGWRRGLDFGEDLEERRTGEHTRSHRPTPEASVDGALMCPSASGLSAPEPAQEPRDGRPRIRADGGRLSVQPRPPADSTGSATQLPSTPPSAAGIGVRADAVRGAREAPVGDLHTYDRPRVGVSPYTELTRVTSRVTLPAN